MKRSTLSLSLHAANRMLQREVPVEALSLLPMVTGLLNTTPLRIVFKQAQVTLVAKMADDGRPRIISAWRN
ncbi:conserved hypothetical protein (plasmid) [Pelobacter propionicus DSM 2379]|uniref:Uncharacterized protein n=1 Tax=Pelobacter propionicus (strain DSM 2379 / NBRC 103807 / OttBd1) TaxID=338966 RepID=A0R7W1_PELPD|nr:conserved hypothetical protein [Pelobacter propionicus DSM 2379]